MTIMLFYPKRANIGQFLKKTFPFSEKFCTKSKKMKVRHFFANELYKLLKFKKFVYIKANFNIITRGYLAFDL